jgi:hypothetical protein
MWSSGDSDPNWIESPLRPVLKAIFENLEGYQTAFLGYILYELGVIDAPRRLELPEELGHVALRSPEGVLFVISFSQEKGIRFHFPDEPNSYDFRGSFLRGFFHYTGDFRWLLEEAEITPDDNTFGTSPLRWWDGVNKVKAAQIKSYEAEHGSTLTITEDRIGIFIWNPPQ